MPRYIDADTVNEKIDNIQNLLGSNENEPCYKGLALAREFINETPTADVVPRAKVSEMFHEIFEIIKKYEVDALTAKENYGVFQMLNFGCDIIKLYERCVITDNTHQE